jgi:hypothetical protein
MKLENYTDEELTNILELAQSNDPHNMLLVSTMTTESFLYDLYEKKWNAMINLEPTYYWICYKWHPENKEAGFDKEKYIISEDEVGKYSVERGDYLKKYTYDYGVAKGDVWTYWDNKKGEWKEDEYSIEIEFNVDDGSVAKKMMNDIEELKAAAPPPEGFNIMTDGRVNFMALFNYAYRYFEKNPNV